MVQNKSTHKNIGNTIVNGLPEECFIKLPTEIYYVDDESHFFVANCQFVAKMWLQKGPELI